MKKYILVLLLLPFFLFGQNTQNISLSAGWSMFSTYIVSENTNIEDVFSSIIDDVIIVKDENGNVYWPEFNLNSIGNLQIGNAYQIKMDNNKELIIDGVVGNCGTDIELNSGWNLIGYLNQLSTPIDEQFASISEELIIIKDDVGNVYWPTYSINTITNLNPGEGFQIKVNSDVTFNYTCSEECIPYNYYCDGGTWQGEVTWEIQNENEETLLSGGAPTSGEICLDNGCYTIIVTDSYGDGWNGNILNIGGLIFSNENLDGCSNCGEESQTFELCVPIIIIEGCTDLDDENYNEIANVDDGSCTYPVSNSNMELVAVYDYDETINDIWGYADGSNEYALVGTNEGFSLVDISTPENPTEIFFIEGAETTWRDIKTWQNYAYIVCDNCNDGLLIVDLLDLTGSTYVFINDFFNKAHNIFIDEYGFLYAFGGNPYGAIILDLNEDPMNPTYAGEFNTYYFHDGMVRDNILWGAAIYQGEFVAIDVSDKENPIILASHPTSSSFTHNCWISNDGNTLFTTDEVSGAYIGAYDVSNLSDIENTDLIQSWSGFDDVIPHNTHVAGNYLVTSYYTDGVTIVDASDPYNLIEVAYFDTSPQYEGEGFYGCWGAYPFLPSGLILATDRQNGLHILSTPYSEFFND